MNIKRLAYGIALALGLMIAPQAQAAGLSAMHYLSDVAVSESDTDVDVMLGLKGAPGFTLEYLSKGIQLTLTDAYLMPAKQHIKVDHPAISEVFAYQFDPHTVRVRLLTDDFPGTDLMGTVRAEAVPGGIQISVIGLPSPIAPAAAAEQGGTALALSHSPAEPPPPSKPSPEGDINTPEGPVTKSAKAEPAPHPEAVVKVADADDIKIDQAAADAAADAEAVGPPVPLYLARENALAEFEKIISNGDDTRSPWTGFKARNPREDVGEPAVLALVHPGGNAARPKGADLIGAGAPADAVEAADAPEHAPATPALPQTEAAVPAEQPAKLTLKPLETLPKGGGAPPLWQSSVKMAAGLALVLALMLGGVALIKRFKVTGLSGRTPIKVLGSAAVGSRQNIVVVEVDGRRLVVGVGPGGIARLGDLEGKGAVPADADAAPESPASGEGDSVEVTAAASPAPEAPANSPNAPLKATPFAQALARADEGNDDGGASEMIARTTRDLKRHLQLLRSGEA